MTLAWSFCVHAECNEVRKEEGHCRDERCF